MVRCYLLPPSLLLPWRGRSPHAGGTQGFHCCQRDRAKCHFSVLALFHAAARHRDPCLSHPPCARAHPDPRNHPPCSWATGSDTGTTLAPWPLQQLRVPALPGETMQPPTSNAPVGASGQSTSAAVRSVPAGAEPARQGSANAPWAKLCFCQGKLPVPKGNGLFPPEELVSLVPPCHSHSAKTPAAGSWLRDADPSSAGSLKPP